MGTFGGLWCRSSYPRRPEKKLARPCGRAVGDGWKNVRLEGRGEVISVVSLGLPRLGDQVAALHGAVLLEQVGDPRGGAFGPGGDDGPPGGHLLAVVAGVVLRDAQPG